uniref:Protein deacetylase HDAC6 n=1 Tax=Scophthalmus maximus TaxID=52904 RepID=A0A8D3CVZ6_SCOMX
RGRMERSRDGTEEELKDRLQKLVNKEPVSLSLCLSVSRFICLSLRLSNSSLPFLTEITPDKLLLFHKNINTKHVLILTLLSSDCSLMSSYGLLCVCRKHYVDMMKSTQTMSESELHTLSESYDSVYLHPESFQVCVLAVGSVLQLVDRVMTSELRNGFAVIRPPGHHAQANQANGFCVFNNVAIAARYAQTTHSVSRVLIVDWDVHHGQGIQYLFQEDPSVLYFSVHRYEQGSFWPHLPESDGGFVGSGRAEGRTMNLSWNKVGMKDADYITAFQQLLLPVAYEFQPELVLVSAGFDAAFGDPKGEMCVSPLCFHVLTHMLMSLAEGRLVLVLEGGYDLQSTAEGAASCVRALLGGACPPLTPPTAPCGPLATGSVIRATSYEQSMEQLSSAPSVATATGLVYDERMMEHLNMWDRHHPEQPQRISKIFSKHQQLGLVARCQRIAARLATEEELTLCHSVQHIKQIKASAVMKARDLHKLGEEFNSIFINNQSFMSAQLAVGGCFNAVERILTGQVSNGVAIVRPPGHHAERDSPCGFCFFNTAALAARHAQKISNHAPLRVLILDWDVHHGNGTQHMFEDDDSVLYISLHRYDNGIFFPSSEDAAPNQVGVAKGAGFNVNVAWSGGRMGDSDYLAAFHHVVMPIATEFNPGLVLVSAGFDAARGDPLGGYNVTPEGYAHLTHQLMSLAGGRVLLILEGGYNLSSISESMAMCTSVLLGDPPPSLVIPLPPPHHSAVAAINEVIQHHAPYWRSLRIHSQYRKCSFICSVKCILDFYVGSLGFFQISAGDTNWCLVSDLSVTGSQTEALAASESVAVGDEAAGGAVVELEAEGSTMYVVDPLSWCPHLDAVKQLPPSGIDVFLPCQDCGSDAENWICLTCYQVLCGRYVNSHMLDHAAVCEHPLVLSFSDLSVWCYLCEAYIHNQILYEAKNAAHCAKFGEEIPPWS